MSDRIWSPQQHAIFDWFRKDLPALINDAMALGLDLETIDVDGHLVVVAFAGTGKTTTILNAIGYAPEPRILLCAFSADIAAELKKRSQNPRAEAKTLHGTGNALVREFLGNVRIDKEGNRKRYLTDAGLSYIRRAHGGMRLPVEVIKKLTTFHLKAREIAPLATEPGSLLDIAFEFECEPEARWVRAGYTVELLEEAVLHIMEVAATDEDGIKRTGIDFSDMIYLPVRNKWMAPLYDMVVVDEAQDMSAAQLLLAQGVLAPGGRMVVIGDPFQAIYGFRGADSTSIDRLKTELKATELSLTDTYRCGTVITAFAARLVPNFRSLAPFTGEIAELSGIPALVREAQYGDFVLSRKNAPLASVAMALLRAEKRTYIRGRQFGDALIRLVETLADKADSMPDFLKRLVVWREKEVDRAIAQGKDAKAEEIHDRAETVAVLSEGVVGLKELQDRIRKLFEDDGQGDAGRVTCSSIHKAKGLEAERVFVLADTLFLKFRGMTPQREQEERNLAYVAYTRAKRVLTLVRTEGAPTLPLTTGAAEEVKTHG